MVCGSTWALGKCSPNTSPTCARSINWEGNNVWVDAAGYFHTLAHAWRGQPTHYPLPGCRYNGAPSSGACTANGGHAYSMDGRTWYVSPVPAFTSTIEYVNGSNLTFRARERSHLVLRNTDNRLLMLGNGVGNPGEGQNVGVMGADHTFVQLQPFAGAVV